MVRPSQTRYGQRVENPPLESSDTARLRVLLQDETQDDWHDQREFNANVEKILAVHQERWKAAYQERMGYASKGDIANLKWVLGAIAAAMAIGFKMLLDAGHRP